MPATARSLRSRPRRSHRRSSRSPSRTSPRRSSRPGTSTRCTRIRCRRSPDLRGRRPNRTSPRSRRPPRTAGRRSSACTHTGPTRTCRGSRTRRLRCSTARRHRRTARRRRSRTTRRSRTSGTPRPPARTQQGPIPPHTWRHRSTRSTTLARRCTSRRCTPALRRTSPSCSCRRTRRWLRTADLHSSVRTSRRRRHSWHRRRRT